jgi:mannosyl-3-phosphoglycerate phosphatase
MKMYSSIYIVFSDLDGTLLDHHTYRYDESLKGIAILRERGIPLVLVSSKTFPEMVRIHRELELDSPLVFENGGGIAFPEKTNSEKVDFAIELIGEEVNGLMGKLDILVEQIPFPIRTLSEMSVEEIASRTGLPRDVALLSRQRETSIPFIIPEDKAISTDEIESINAQLREYNLSLTRGGRFYHFLSLDANKGNSVRRIIEYYRARYRGERICSIAIGDSENDIPMLKVVDMPYLVGRTDGRTITVDFDLKRMGGIGPAGFSEAIESLLL